MNGGEWHVKRLIAWLVLGSAVALLCGCNTVEGFGKDVKAAGAHDTCALGEGVVNVAACLKALRELRYTGSYSWEDEPEDRNPLDSAVRNREWIERQLVA